MLLKKLHLTSAVIFACAMMILVAGCSKDDVVEVIGVCPIVLSTIPADGDINVPLHQIISIKFNEDLNPSTVNAQTIKLNGSAAIAGTVTYSDSTAFFKPSANLLPNTTYTGTVTTGIKDPMGNALQENYVWSFKTIPEITLSATPAEGGTVTGAGLFNEGSTVTVVATPNEGYVFNNWTIDGTIVSTSASYEFEMNGNKDIVGNFAVSTYTLDITAQNGTVSKNADAANYEHGTEVVLTATPAAGYQFSGWSGDASGSVNPLTVTMNSDKNVTANFTLIPIVTYTLNVTAVNGTVAKNPNPATYNTGSTVTLTATPATGYRFTGWSGNASGSTNPLTVTMNANKNITANFALIAAGTFTLNVTAQNGTVSKTPNQATYASGAQVVLTPTPATGYRFSGWSGDASGTANPLTVTMNGNKNITANFTQIPANTFTLNVTAQNGTVSKTPNQASYNSGTVVVLNATPAAGYQFTGWSGDATGSTNPLSVTMNSNKNITANFTQIQANTYTLNVTAQNGTVSKNPNQDNYNSGSTVMLTATANAGYQFSGWSGDATGSNNPLTVIMNSNKNITANFTQITNAGQICPNPAVNLGAAGNYAILAKSGISTTGTTSVTGNLGVSPITSTAITGFGLILSSDGTYSTSSLVTGRVYAADYTSPTPANLSTAVSNMETAFTTANGLAPDQTGFMAGNLNGQTLASGVYKWSTGLLVTNSITLDGGGVDCAKFVFQIAGDLTIANNTKIILINGAKADNIYWVVAGAGAKLGTDVDFSGNILSQTLISVNTRSSVNGRLLAQSAVTLNGNAIVKPSN